jgi:hypothetical protein
MNRRPRRNHTPAFKAKVALAAVKNATGRSIFDRAHSSDANGYTGRSLDHEPAIEQTGLRVRSPSSNPKVNLMEGGINLTCWFLALTLLSHVAKFFSNHLFLRVSD